MGKDKTENEQLIAYGLPEDVWFHVDDLSSAHVYLRLQPNQTMDDISESDLEECLQLVKHNSIEGVKAAAVDVVYTPWSNLKKTASMEVGQVGFHDEHLVRKAKVKKDNKIFNRLNKTKTESYPDLQQLQEIRMSQIRKATNQAKAKERELERERAEQKRMEQEQRSYKDFMNPDKMTSNTNAGNIDEDFW